MRSRFGIHWKGAPRRERARLARVAALAVLCLGLPTACGGASGRIAATVSVSPQPKWSASLAAQRVRILLADGFKEVAIDESHRGRRVVAKAAGGGITLQDNRGRALDSGDGFRLDPAPGRLIRVDGTPYRGSVEVFVNPLGVPVAVNELSIEDYLRGVVAKELSPRLFPYPEALKTQAVAARTYTVSGLRGQARHGFDLYGDVRSQVYGGQPGEDPVSDQAVRQTRGTVAVYQGKPIAAFYSSTCGGKTANYADFFQGGEIPYLKGGVPCGDASSRYHRWKETIRIADVKASLDRYAGVGRLKSLKIGRRASDRRVLEMEFEGESATKTLRGFDLRFALGLRSNWISKLVPDKDPQGWLRSIEVEGAGFGHGVGLCQIGAVEMAQKGAGFERILRHYYPGIEIAQVY